MSQHNNYEYSNNYEQKEHTYEQVCIALTKKSIALKEGARIAHVSEKQMRHILNIKSQEVLRGRSTGTLS